MTQEKHCNQIKIPIKLLKQECFKHSVLKKMFLTWKTFENIVKTAINTSSFTNKKNKTNNWNEKTKIISVIAWKFERSMEYLNSLTH